VRLQGWCQFCRKVKAVRVSGAMMASAARGLAIGVCAQCEEKQEDRPKLRQLETMLTRSIRRGAAGEDTWPFNETITRLRHRTTRVPTLAEFEREVTHMRATHGEDRQEAYDLALGFVQDIKRRGR
jgi:hypothetical protein